MSGFNRAITVLFFLLLLGLSVAAIVIAQVDLGRAGREIRDWAGWFTADGDRRAVVTGGAAAVALLSLIVLGLEFGRPGRRGEVLLRSSSGETVVMSREIIEERLEAEMAAIPGVVRAAADVSPHGRAADVTLDLHVLPVATVPDIVHAVSTRLTHTVREELGVALRRQPMFRIRRVAEAPRELRPGTATAEAQAEERDRQVS